MSSCTLVTASGIWLEASLVPLKLSRKDTGTYLRQSTIVPDIAMEGVGIPDVSDLTVLGVLEYWIQSFVSRNLSHTGYSQHPPGT